jgi:hypothetical protein
MPDQSSEKPPKKKVTVTPEQIERFLERTGFVFEMRMNEVFLKAGYATEINAEFLDLEGDTLREIDIVATKVINDINVHFIVECKQSVTDKWIFICYKRMPRYYPALKHLPRVPVIVLKKRGLFSSLHTFDRNVPLGSNYLCYSIEGEHEKKAGQLQIKECAHKLPKALVYFASRANGQKHLFFPVALFAGQIFAVLYKDKLIVEERSFLQHYVEFLPEIYRRKPEPEPQISLASMYSLFEMDTWLKESRERDIRRITAQLSPHYQIDFVTEGGISSYLALIEKQVEAIPVKYWPIPEVEPAKAPPDAQSTSA